MALTFADIDETKLSPMMQQYVAEKKKRPDCLLLFRLGDFYEMFFDDAVTASKALELTLTSRDCGLAERAPMAGVPYHAVEGYIARLLDQGYKVAICEQMEDPALAKGLVRREVTKIITPGTVTDLQNVDEKKNNFLVSVYKLGACYGLAAADLTTGDFLASELLTGLTDAHVYDEIHRFAPAELLCNEAFRSSVVAEKLLQEQFYLTVLPDRHFATEAYEAYFPENPLNQDLLKAAASGLLFYVEDTQKQLPPHLQHIQVYEIRQFMNVGYNARRNLELTETLSGRKKRGSLLWVLDHCRTAMGSRMLRRWVEQPLLQPMEISYRQSAVAELKDSFILRKELREILDGMNDLQRLSGKLSLGTVNARDLASVGRTLAKIPALKERLETCQAEALTRTGLSLDALEELVKVLAAALADELPIGVKDGGMIRDGYDQQVDEYRETNEKGSSWILDLEAREREATGIKNLKVGYNRVFGYYVEVSKSNLPLVPEHYNRRQTLTNAERYILPELKEMEDKILGAKQKLLSREYDVFVELREAATREAEVISRNAILLAELDCWLSLAEVADLGGYVRPELVLEPVLDISGGRHPVVEKMLPSGAFVANDALLDESEHSLILLTGPNMSGKSTYMRQVALIVILAQMGSFVPATSAKIGIVDQIFTRIGASDDLGSGQSTFMVEMNEVSHILQNASSRSLLILDEIGRGTSTYDGLSIAWAVLEHIANKKILGARTLFATHYHELTDLEGLVPGIKNYHVAVQKREGEREIRFLHHIEAGATDESYGIEVARLAGIDSQVVDRAYEILYQLEQANLGQAKRRLPKTQKVMEGQLDLFSSSLALQKNDRIMTELTELDIQNMTPLDALRKLYDLSVEAKKIRGAKD